MSLRAARRPSRSARRRGRRSPSFSASTTPSSRSPTRRDRSCSPPSPSSSTSPTVLVATATAREAEQLRARSGAVSRRRRRRAAAGMGDAALRARVAGDRDDGPQAPHDVAPAPRVGGAARRPGRDPARSRRPCRRRPDPGPVCNGSARGSKTPSRSSSARVPSWTPRSSWHASSTPGYRREYQVEARGELAVRGGIVDVFGSTANQPIRIDLFGDEVERLTAFEVAGQRSVADLEQVELFGCRELVLTEDVRERARAAVARGAVRPRQLREDRGR